MGGIALVAEGVAGRATRLDPEILAHGVVDMWAVALASPRMFHLADGIATLGSNLAIVCVRLDALPPPDDPLVQVLLALAGRGATHGMALGVMTDNPDGSGQSLQPQSHVAYAEFSAGDDRAAGRVTRALANCVARGDAPLGVRGSALAWRACVAGAATALQQNAASPES
jgi:hypothetical protein